MSTYENYTIRSATYDDSRWALGVELVLGCLASGSTPLHELAVLDAGCGTGNYAAAVLPKVARVEAIDASAAMLDVAGRKLANEREAGRIGFAQASIDDLPLPDAAVDAVMVNQVLHHLGDVPDTGWPAHRRALAELVRVLRPGGTLVINTCSQVQLRDGYWYYSLIPRAAQAVRRRTAPLDVLEARLTDHGLELLGRFVPVDGVIQGDAYFDPRGPLRDDWRAAESTWALVDDDELAAAQAEIVALDDRGELASSVAARDARRRDVGQITILGARRDAS